MNPLEVLTPSDLRRRTSVKWRAYPDDVLPLFIAEMDTPLAEPIAEALRRAVEIGDTGYAFGPTYGEALARFAERRWGFGGFDPANMRIVPDVMLGAVEVLRLITGPGDAVVITPPVYAPFKAFVSHDARRVVEAPLAANGRLDLEALERAFSEATAASDRAAFLLCNPHNPTGTVHTVEELDAVADLARAHRVRVVSDEIHAPLVLPGATFTPYLSIDEHGFSLTSASKAWNLAGLKAALAVAGPAAAADLDGMPEEVGHGASHFGSIAHTAAFDHGGPWLDDLLVGLDANRRLLADLVATRLPKVRHTSPEGTYLAWLDCRELGYDEQQPVDGPPTTSEIDGPAAFFLERARVALSAGHVFGTGGAGHVRLNFATSPAILTEAIDRMAGALE